MLIAGRWGGEEGCVGGRRRGCFVRGWSGEGEGEVAGLGWVGWGVDVCWVWVCGVLAGAWVVVVIVVVVMVLLVKG